jgi:hypothetical protein
MKSNKRKVKTGLCKQWFIENEIHGRWYPYCTADQRDFAENGYNLNKLKSRNE